MSSRTVHTQRRRISSKLHSYEALVITESDVVRSLSHRDTSSTLEPIAECRFQPVRPAVPGFDRAVLNAADGWDERWQMRRGEGQRSRDGSSKRHSHNVRNLRLSARLPLWRGSKIGLQNLLRMNGKKLTQRRLTHSHHDGDGCRW